MDQGKDNNGGYIRIGNLTKPIENLEFLNEIKESLKLNNLKYTPNMPKYIQKIAICTGSGAGFIDLAKKEKPDVFITGDVKYHDAQRALEQDIWVIDAGHFGTEGLVGELFKEILENKFNTDEISIYISESSCDFFNYV